MGLDLQFFPALKEGRKGQGLTPNNIKKLIREDYSWRQIAEARFFQQLAKAKREAVEVAVLTYLRVVAGRLDDRLRIVIDGTLNLGITPGATMPKSLTERQPILMKALGETGGVSTYRDKVEEPALDAFSQSLNSPLADDFVAMGWIPQTSLNSAEAQCDTARQRWWCWVSQ